MGKAAVPFWDRVQKSEGCWEWTGARRDFGHGRAIVNRKSVPAHRRAWELTNGPIPDGLQVLHHCDNPPCVRPAHLFLGTQLDNLADMDAKGRRARGDRHSSHLHPELRQGVNNHAKLTDDAVRELREAATHGFKWGELSRLARKHGVGRSAAWAAAHGKGWKHVV